MPGTLAELYAGILRQRNEPQGVLSQPATSNPLMMAKALRQEQSYPRTPLSEAINAPMTWQQFFDNVQAHFPIDSPAAVRQAAFDLGKSVGPQMLAGVNAKTADLGKKAAAEKMLAEGKSPAVVWQETGWGVGPDGKWRFEIPDNAASFASGMPTWARLSQDRPIGETFSHPDLYRAYPELQNIKLAANEPGSHAAGSFGDGKISIDGVFTPAARKKVTSTTVHELQHAVQGKEGFARGGGLDDAWHNVVKARVNFLNGELGRIAKEIDSVSLSYGNPKPGMANKYAELKSEYEASMAEKMKLWDQAKADPLDAYRRLAGEAEARLAQSRIGMNPEQRAAQYPFDPNYFRKATGVHLNQLIFPE